MGGETVMPWTLLDSGTYGFADGSGGHACTYPGGQPASGDLLILAVASDTTVTTPTGYALAVSDVVNQGDYLYYKVAGASEASAVTITTTGDFPTVVGYLRYSGAAATPLDVTAAARANNADAFTTPSVSPAALAGTGELAVFAACCQEPSAGVATSPTASAGYTIRLDTGLTGSGSLGMQAFVAARTDATGSETPSITWATSQYRNRTGLFAAFTPPASVDATVTVPAAASATGSASAPGVAGSAAVTVPAAATAVAEAVAPDVPLATVRGGQLAASTAPQARLAGSASAAGPSRP